MIVVAIVLIVVSLALLIALLVLAPAERQQWSLWRRWHAGEPSKPPLSEGPGFGGWVSRAPGRSPESGDLDLRLGKER